MTKILISAFVACLLSSVCYGQTWSTMSADVLIDMNTSTPGTTITTAILNAGTVSSTCTVGSGNCGYSSAGSGFQVGANQGTCSNLGPVQMNGTGGTLFPANSLNYNNLSHDDSSNGSVGPVATFGAGTHPNVRVIWCFTSGLPKENGGFLSDILMMESSAATQYFDAQLEDYCPPTATNVYGLGLENRNGPGGIQHPTCISVPPATATTQPTYYVTMNWDMANGVGTEWVFTPQGTLIGHTYLPEVTPAYAQTRIFSNEGASNAGTRSEYQNLMFDYSTSAPSGTVSVVQNSPTVTWVSGSQFVSGPLWGQSQWGGYMYFGAPNSCTNSSGGTINIACPSVMYPISSCQSATVCTLTSNYTGASGTIAYAAELPMFWSNESGSTTVQPPTNVHATAQ
jgi:hypothetical protein